MCNNKIQMPTTLTQINNFILNSQSPCIFLFFFLPVALCFPSQQTNPSISISIIGKHVLERDKSEAGDSSAACIRPPHANSSSVE